MRRRPREKRPLGLLLAVALGACASTPDPADRLESEVFRVLTWNVHYGAALEEERAGASGSIARTLREHPALRHADVLGLQEVCSGGGGWQLDYFAAAFREMHGASFHAFAPSDPADPEPCARGEAIFSRHPITASGVLELPVVRQPRSAVWADLRVAGARGPTLVRVYDAHLENRAGLWSAEHGRLRQMLRILDHLRAWRAEHPSAPVILLGDLNTLGPVFNPWAEEELLVELRRTLRPSIERPGRTLTMLPYAVDWIFFDALALATSSIVPVSLSDHYPVVADFDLPQDADAP